MTREILRRKMALNERLLCSAGVLKAIEPRRERGLEGAGTSIEKNIIDRELAELVTASWEQELRDAWSEQ